VYVAQHATPPIVSVDRHDRQGDQQRADPLVQEPRGEEQDREGLDRPQHHGQACGDVDEAEEAESVGQARVEHAKPTENRRRGPITKRQPAQAHERQQESEARSELDRQEREGRQLGDGALADDGPKAPAGGSKGQCEGGSPVRDWRHACDGVARSVDVAGGRLSAEAGMSCGAPLSSDASARSRSATAGARR
jgi:hypothetical protein